jgi:hypothetical protein
MSYVFDPNRNPFSRRRFAEAFRLTLDVHPLERKRQEPIFKAGNPDGYQHDLGALDVFLDNFGMLYKEQAQGGEWAQGLDLVDSLLRRAWERSKRKVFQDELGRAQVQVPIVRGHHHVETRSNADRPARRAIPRNSPGRPAGLPLTPGGNRRPGPGLPRPPG